MHAGMRMLVLKTSVKQLMFPVCRLVALYKELIDFFPTLAKRYAK
jgi:hypothetical protein